MADRKIACFVCDKDLGIIRDAKLRVNISHTCEQCTTIIKLTLKNPDFGKRDNPFADIFGEIFNKRY